MTVREVTLTPQQAALVEQYDRAFGVAERELRLVLDVILAGAQVSGDVHYRGVRRVGKRAVLVLEMPAAPAGGG